MNKSREEVWYDAPQPSNGTDSEVIGFADQPRPGPQLALPPSPPPQANNPPPLNPPNTNTNAMDLEATPKNVLLLKGWRKRVDRAAVGMALLFPFLCGLILSFSALSRVPWVEAPWQIWVACISSLLEVGSILICFLCALSRFEFPERVQPPTEGLPPGTVTQIPMPWGQKIFLIWLAVLSCCPFLFGIIVWSGSSGISCRARRQAGECRVGPDFIAGIGAFRALGTYFVLAVVFLLQQSLKKRLLSSQKREDAQAT